MSAAAVILPQVWACLAGGTPVASVAAAVHERKGPHALRLVQAAEPEVVARRYVSPELAFYRKYTEALLRRYMKLSMESGRVPSLLGQEMFRGKVTNYKVTGFDDVVIFVHDVGACIAKLGKGQQCLIERIAVQEYTQEETAALLGLTLRTVVRKYAQALDELTRILLMQKMLLPLSECKEAEG